MGTGDRVKDKHGATVIDYLKPLESETDQQILDSVNAALAELAIGGVDSGDIAHDSDDDGAGSGSGSDDD